MATSVAIPAPYSDNLFRRVARLVPGLFLLISVGYAGKFVEQSIARYGNIPSPVQLLSNRRPPFPGTPVWLSECAAATIPAALAR